MIPSIYIMAVLCNGSIAEFDSAGVGSNPSTASMSVWANLIGGIYLKNPTLDALHNIQNKLVAPKSQYNSFGKYNFRSCEDIMVAVKPLLAEYGATLHVSDQIILIGDRYYVCATASICSLLDGAEPISTTAYAREEETLKGMAASQITGATSSYARKYCLSGLFCLDDQKDADAMKPRAKKQSANTPNEALKAKQQEITNLAKKMINEDGVSRDTVNDIVAAHNKGKRNPNTIETVESCEQIISELKALKKASD